MASSRSAIVSMALATPAPVLSSCAAAAARAIFEVGHFGLELHGAALRFRELVGHGDRRHHRQPLVADLAEA
ncbi:MAG: hypothetical protein WDN31_16995 [Hyphomicrobium sp.]